MSNITLYHIISNDNLDKKILFSKENNGKLLLTQHSKSLDSTNGFIKEYIHCLKYLVSGIDFAANRKKSAIKIEILESAKIFNYKGKMEDLDFNILNEYDIAFLKYDELGLRWQEILLLNNEVVKNWTYDKNIIKEDFNRQLELLIARKINKEDFFYRDIEENEQIEICKLLGKELNILEITKEEEIKAREVLDTSSYRIGVYGFSITKKLFFSNQELLNKLKYINDIVKKQTFEYCIGKKDIISWDKFQAFFENQTKLIFENINNLKSLSEVGYLRVIYSSTKNNLFNQGEDLFEVFIGVDIKDKIIYNSFETIKNNISLYSSAHKGNFQSLENTYNLILKEKSNISKLSEVFINFEGALSDRNNILIEIY